MTRDETIRDLLLDVLWQHADPTSPFYNDCDEDLCLWCETALRVLRGMAVKLPESVQKMIEDNLEDES